MKAVNLLPSEHRSAPKAAPVAKGPAPGGSSFGAYAVLGALAMAVVMVASYVLVSNSVKDRRAELASVQSEAQLVRAQAAALKPYADFRQLAVQRVATVRQLAESRFDWERALRDVSRALPGDVHLKSFKGSVSSGAAGGSSTIRGNLQVPAIELSGCTRTQSAVAKLMARLRGVRGVTRVSLQKSEKPDQQGATGSVQPGQGPLCGKGNPPAFDLVMFFERAAVAPPTVTVPGQAPGAAPAGAAQPAASGQPAASPTPAPAGSTTEGVTTP